jgi:glycosyltransferase involved in cell wall biosynthesis
LSAPPEVSIVVPIYRNRATLRPLHQRLERALAPWRWELLFVDDGCPEGSLAVAASLAEEDPRVAVLAHARNAGQNAAVLTGLAYTRAPRVVVLDADLQDPPEAIPLLLEALQPGVAAVFAGRRGWYESASRLLTSFVFKRLLHWRSGGVLPRDAGLFVAMSQEMVRRVLAQPGGPLYVLRRMADSGLPMRSLPVRRQPNPEGRSAYTFAKRLRLAWRALQPRPPGAAAAVPPVIRLKLGARFQNAAAPESRS